MKPVRRTAHQYILYVFLILACIVGSIESWNHYYAERKVSDTADCTLDPAACYTCKVHHFFSPRHNIRRLILDILDSETKHVRVAAFKFTDSAIANKLVELHQRGVQVEVLTDSSGLDSRIHKPLELHHKGIPVFVFPGKNVPTTMVGPIMHHKFMVLSRPRITGGKKLVITGSLNLTKSALENNCENISVIIGDEIADQYAHEFDYIVEQEAEAI